MKKVFLFLRSMRFGMILLCLIMILSLAGSLIPQGEEAMTYVRAYGAGAASWIIRLGIDDLFHSWYFLLIMGLLCGNLLLCSILRFPKTLRTMEGLKRQAKEAEWDHPLAPGQAEKIRDRLSAMHFRRDGNLYTAHGIGAYGSFLVHLSILLILLFGSLTLMMPKIQDLTVLPGDSLTLADGTEVTCLSFRIENEKGELDYTSLLRAISPGGDREKEQEVRVNEPLRFGQYKIYQQTYGTAGRVLIQNEGNGAEETLYLTEPAFLSIDSRNGVYFQTLYPGYIQEDDGSYTLITSTAMGYADPVYSVQSISEGSSASVLAFPGETIRIGEISFTFLEPEEYPGLRIKTLSPFLYGGLYFGFGLIVAALYLCFFHTPVCVRVEEEGVVIRASKEVPELRAQLDESGQGEFSI